jgi:glyoxylase-like metal-dependent hydrolase (beta-lactamase superfamily II)
MIEEDYDVFGDGSVQILKAPGHTPGHSVLEVKLRKSGVVILSGDLYHSRENRIERIVKNTGARFIVQHDEADFASLPKFPEFLE